MHVLSFARGAVATAAALVLAAPAIAAAGEAPGLTVVLAPVDTFAGPLDAWTRSSGGNVQVSLGVDTNTAPAPALQVVFSRRNPADDSAAANYFGMRRLLAEVPAGIDGLRITLSASEAQSVYLGLSVLSGQWWHEYGSGPFQPSRLGPDPTTFYIPLAQLKSGSTPFNPASDRICGISLSGRAPVGTLRVHELSFCRKVAAAGWVTAAARTSNPSTIFERGAPIAFSLKPGSRPVPAIDSLVYAIRDGGQDAVVARGTLDLGTNSVLDLRLPSLPTGYYELALFPAKGGVEMDATSCLKSAGSAPPGRLPFAVMPATIEENIARIRKVGEDAAFFGIHNLRFQYKLHELMAFPWCLRNARWNEYEGSAMPVRGPDGVAPWAAKKLASEAPQPDYLFAFTSFNPNHVEQIPSWALTGPDQTPGFRWEQFGPFVADQLRLTSHLYPAQKRHLVEGAWEIHLNRPPYSQKPVYDDAAIVELFRRLRPVVRAADSNAVFVGAGLVPEADFIGKLADAGFLDQVDGLALHCYGDPEALIGRLTALREALAARGKAALPLYDSECGFTSDVGGVQRLHEQAAKLVRQNLVLKGEGVIAHLTFYPFDYGREGEGTYGLCFSLDDRMGFGPVALAPKPAVPALAVCAHELLGAKPAWRLQGWADAVYGYCFLRDGEPVLALWTTGPARTLRVPAGDRSAVHVTGFLGREEDRKVVDGAAGIDVADAPVYVSGLMADLYTAPRVGGSRQVYPGQAMAIDLPGGCTAARSWGLGVTLDAATRQVKVAVPSTCAAGPRPVLFTNAQGAGLGVAWFVVLPAVEVTGCRPIQEGTHLDLQVSLANHAAEPESAAIRACITGSGAWASQTSSLPAGAAAEVRLRLAERSEPLQARDVLPVSIVVASGRADPVRMDRRLTFLCARRIGATAPLVAPEADHIQLAGPGSSGTPETADISLGWDPQRLRITVVRNDDIQYQPSDNGDMWRGDSLQLAFDTDPDSDRPYDPMVYAVSKKVTEVTVSRTAAGCKAWRHTTYNRNELPLGVATNWGMAWERDEAAHTTRMTVDIPWSEIGLASAPVPGQQLGMAALINDLDGDKAPRRCLELFGGINSTTKSYKEFGRLTLR